MKEWIDAKIEPPRKDIPILIVTLFYDFPYTVTWIEEGIYGTSSFYEANGEYETKESYIVYWMPCPKWPELIP